MSVARDPDAPLNWKLVFAILFVLAIPVTVAVRVFWIPHTLGAFGIGITVAYAVVLALMWTGRAPRERKPRQPNARTEDAWIYFRLIGGTGFLTVVNLEPAPMRVPGLADGVAAGVTVEALQSGESKATVSLAPRTPPPGPVMEIPPTKYDFVSAGFDPEHTPSGRTVRLELGNALAALPSGAYDLRVRWDLSPFAAPGLWTPPTPLVLGVFPFRK